MENNIKAFQNPYAIDDAFLKGRPLSYSSLKEFRESPRHYITYLQKPRDLDAYVLERAVDCMALTPERYAKTFHVYEKFEKRTNEAKDKWKTMTETAQKNGITLIDKPTDLQAQIMVEALHSHPDAHALLEAKKRAQIELKWIDKETGLPIRGFLDFDAEIWDSEFIVDLKTAENGQPEYFNKKIFQFGYNLQAGTYLTGYQKKFFKFPGFLNLVVEKTEPYNVTILYFDNKEAQKAKDEFNGLLKAFKICKDRYLWHTGYDFYLYGMNNKFPVTTPGYYKPRASGYDTE